MEPESTNNNLEKTGSNAEHFHESTRSRSKIAKIISGIEKIEFKGFKADRGGA